MPYVDCYDGAPTRCSGGPRPGTIVLSEYVMDYFPGVGTFGIYDCRPNTGDPDQLSIHSDGRAWDAAIPLDAAGLALGNEVAAWLVAHHEILGVQLVIWNRRDWNVVRGTWDSYSGPNPHRDHIHNEQCLAAANTLTRADLDAAFNPPLEEPDVPFMYWYKDAKTGKKIGPYCCRGVEKPRKITVTTANELKRFYYPEQAKAKAPLPVIAQALHNSWVAG